MTYSRAKHLLFNEVENRGGAIRDAYTGRTFALDAIGRASAVPVNTEHAYPRARGVAGTRAESDLFHLFPTESVANRERGDLPYGEVARVEWSAGGATRGVSASGREVFEPPANVKGDLARAVLYVSLAYGLPVDAEQESALRAWNKADPVDAAERRRAAHIEKLQGNQNPLIADPSLADRVDDF